MTKRAAPATNPKPPRSPAITPRAGSFHIEQEVLLKAPLAKAWKSLLDVDSWWCHHYRPGSRLILEPKAAGRFAEIGPKGFEALFGTVTFIEPRRLVRLNGPLGMHTLPVNSVYSYELTEVTGGTLLKLSHRAVGLLDPGWARSHKSGWQELWGHLTAFVETGKRYKRSSE